MRLVQKLMAKAGDNWNQPPVTIAFLGDSVTQGCFEVYQKEDGRVATFFDKNSAYHQYVARILTLFYPEVPVNMINAGISGSNAPHGLERLERDVLAHHPDLTVVCFGLNDAMAGPDGLQNYTNALEAIFLRLQEADCEIIFMTPNMMATQVSCHLSNDMLRSIAQSASRTQNEGIMDVYMNTAKSLCMRLDIPVCDCYARWKTLQHHGVNVTELLANKINHPTREMNWLFAGSLVETILS